MSKENLEFQTEVSQLLNLMIHSLYSNREIFLRELISNASDACDKLRVEALADDSLYEGNSDFNIEITFNEKERTLTISDSGVGMSKEEVVANLAPLRNQARKSFLANYREIVQRLCLDWAIWCRFLLSLHSRRKW